jgi:hypothetical protein
VLQPLRGNDIFAAKDDQAAADASRRRSAGWHRLAARDQCDGYRTHARIDGRDTKLLNADVPPLANTDDDCALRHE